MNSTVVGILLFMIVILVFTSIALFHRDVWTKIQDYTPSWVDEKIFIMVIYLLLVTIAISWVTISIRSNKFTRYAIGNLYLIFTILLYFVIFLMGEDDLNSTELIVLSSISLVLITLTLLGRYLLPIVPFLIYVYLFAIIYEIKNNNE
jgi:uncharacterized membrane protein